MMFTGSILKLYSFYYVWELYAFLRCLEFKILISLRYFDIVLLETKSSRSFSCSTISSSCNGALGSSFSIRYNNAFCMESLEVPSFVLEVKRLLKG